MNERVAKVIADSNLDGCETTLDGGNILACVGSCLCRDTARRAIEAAREPTTAMAETGQQFRTRHSIDVTQRWKAMIDAALSDKATE